MDDPLRRRSVGAPAARSLLLTILGEFVLPRGEAVWQETLVAALVSVGYSEQAARQALARSVRDGWLSTERLGRRSRVSLSDRAAGFLATGAARIYSFGEPWDWDERWLVLILRVPEARREVRHVLRTRLAWAGLGSLGGGVWLTPHVEREAELASVIAEEPAAEATSFVASLGALGQADDVVAAAWDLEAVREHYDAFIEDFQRDPSLRRRGDVPDADPARARLAQVPVLGSRSAGRAAAVRLAPPARPRAVRGSARTLG